MHAQACASVLAQVNARVQEFQTFLFIVPDRPCLPLASLILSLPGISGAVSGPEYIELYTIHTLLVTCLHAILRICDVPQCWETNNCPN